MRPSFLLLLLTLLQQRPVGSIEGVVTNTATGAAIAGASVRFATYSALTGADGRFVVQGVAPGRYTVIPSQDRFVITHTRPGGPTMGYPVTVAPGEQVKNLRLALTPTSVITGRIVDANREPRSAVTVSLIPANNSSATAATSIGAPPSAQTDERGQYRLFNIPPGEYFLRVAPGTQLADFIPSYYPGVPVVEQAVPVKVAAGSDLSGMDFSLVGGRLFSVKFKLASPDPLPSDLRFSVRPHSGGFYTPGSFLEPKVTDGNTFTLAGIPPGRYSLQVVWGGFTLSRRERFPLEIVDEDLDLGNLALTSGATIPIHVVADNNLPIAFNPQSARINLWPAVGDNGAPVMLMPGASQAENVAEGLYLIRATGLPSPLYISSARAGGQDVLSGGLLVEGNGPKAPLEITISGPAGTVSGTVRNAKEEPASTVVILVPGADRRANTDFFAVTLSDQNGSFSFSNVRPGDYSILAGDYTMADVVHNPKLLAEVLPRAAKVTAQKGSSPSVAVHVVVR